MSEQQSETTITVSSYGKTLCVLAEYMMRSATVGYYAYGQGVLDAAISAASAVQTVAVRANSRYWRDETLMSGLTNLIRNQVKAAFEATLRAEPESRPKARETLTIVLRSVEEQARTVDESFVESALHELEQIGDELEGIKRFYENASKDAERVERTSFPALAALAVTVNGLGKQSAIARWLPFLASPEKRLREFQARFQSAEESLQDTSDSVHNAALTMTRDADLLDTEAAYQRDRIQDIAADIHAVRIIRDDAEARVEELRATGDEGDAVLADALHSSVVDAADRRENELLGQVGTALYVCQELAIASQSARMLAGQAVQTLNNTIPVLKAQTLVRTALGTQEMVGDTLDAVNAAVAKLTDENTQLIGKNITGMVAREKSTIARVEDIKRNLDALTGFIVDARAQLSTLGEERRANSRELTEYVAPLVDKLEARREIDGGSVNVL